MTESIQNKHKVVMVGLPQAGKSTYLAAFWNTVLEGKIPKSLKLESVLPDQRKYLNEICDEWLNFKQLSRNLSLDIDESFMDVKEDDGNLFSLYFPDVSGETYRVIVEDRVWNQAFEEVLVGVTGLLVILHPGEILPASTINEVDRLTVVINGEEVSDENDEEMVDTSKEAPVEWSASLVSQEVKMVDLIQLLTTDIANTSVSQIGIVVSAWDMVKDHFNNPNEYLVRSLPMLHQFLNANCDTWDYRVFGISAQGGDYEKEKDMRELTNLTDLSKRAKLYGISTEEAHPNDVTFPVKWLLK